MDYCNWSKFNYKISWNYDSSKIKEEQILEIDTLEDSLEVSFKDVLFSIKESTETVLKFLNISSEKEISNIKSYLKRFKFDVDDEFRGDIS